MQSVRGTCPDRSNDSRQKSAPFAERTGLALIEAQHPSGGWNYIHDFAGETSLREWYANVGANGWRLEEFQHYYGNATFDDAGTAVSSQFMLRMYLFADRVMTSPVVSATDVVAVMDKLDPKGYWLTPLSAVTNPYKGGGPSTPYTGDAYRSKHVGDVFDTSPYDPQDPPLIEPCVKKEQPQGITVASFVSNMGKLIAFTAPVV